MCYSYVITLISVLIIFVFQLEEHDKELTDATNKDGQSTLNWKERTLEDMSLEAFKLKSHFGPDDTIDN